MTWFKPTLILSRLLITRSGRAVYDEGFHYGLNVIRGNNSSGKTTITKAIVYALGGNVKNWAPELLLCDFVIAEVRLNDQFVTLRRPIEGENFNHMEIYWGSYPAASEADISLWEKYPYSSTQNKSGFSSVLFKSLGLPEVKGNQRSSLTMHQILRLMYGDQSSPANRILGIEDFDAIITREAIGDLLFGIYSDELFNARITLGKKEKDLSSCLSELKSLFAVLGRQESDIKSFDIDAEISSAVTRLKLLEDEIESQKHQAYLQDEDPKNLELKKALKESKDSQYAVKERLSALDFDIADSEVFINELKYKLHCLNDSLSMAAVTENFSYKTCPACFSDLEKLNRSDNQCTLCGSELGGESSELNLHKIRNEIELQVNESASLLVAKFEELNDLRNSSRSLEMMVKSLGRRYKDVATDIATEHQKALQSMYHEIGYLERAIEDLSKSREIIEQINAISRDRDDLNSEISNIKLFIEAKEAEQEKRRAEVAEELSTETARLLREDLERQGQFAKADYVQVDFGGNSISVNGETSFSESSTVFLKNAFLLAILSVSAHDSRLRFPRFLILDGIENGGMERERSHNLQRIILGLSDTLEVDHQIIVTTAEIAPEIERSAATVGRSYTSEHKSLEFNGASNEPGRFVVEI